MEVLAAEFPDIFQQFIEIVPDPNKPEQLIYSENENEYDESSPQPVDDGGSSSSSPPALAPDDATPEMITPSSIFMEHDYGQKVFLKDANKNMTKITSQAFINTTFSNDEGDRTQEKMSAFVPVEDGRIHSMPNSSYVTMIDERIVPDQMTTVCSKPKAELSSPFSELEDILCDLALLHHDHNANVETLLEAEKSGHGCSWSAGGGCVHLRPADAGAAAPRAPAQRGAAAGARGRGGGPRGAAAPDPARSRQDTPDHGFPALPQHGHPRIHQLHHWPTFLPASGQQWKVTLHLLRERVEIHP